MTIKPTNWSEYKKQDLEEKLDIEEPPEPIEVPLKNIGGTDVGKIMSNTRLGVLKYLRISKYPIWLGIAFVKEFNQYTIIGTSKCDVSDGWINIAHLETDEGALGTIVIQRKEELLEEPEFERLKKLYESVF